MDIIALALLVTAFAGLASMMATPRLRQKLVGESPVANAAVPLLAGGLVWAANATTSVLTGWVSDSTAPRANVQVFVEDITFGIPPIPQTYKERTLSGKEIESLLRPLAQSDEVIRLTADESERLNAISKRSVAAGSSDVTPHRSYDMAEVVKIFFGAFAYYSEYTRWETVSKNWSEFLRLSPLPPADRMGEFVNSEVRGVIDAPGIFAVLTSTAGLEGVSLEIVDENDCDERSPAPAAVIRHDGGYVLDARRFQALVAPDDSHPARLRRVEQFGKLVEQSCVMTLSRAFSELSKVFAKEHRYMDEYLRVWNEIIADRKPSTMSVKVTISNVGKFDTYISREIKALIGGAGQDKALPLKLVARDRLDDDTDSHVVDSPYLAIKSRTAQTYQFHAALDEHMRRQVHGAYVSGLTYIRLGVLASSGDSTEPVLSRVVPFSEEAKDRARQQVDQIPISI